MIVINFSDAFIKMHGHGDCTQTATAHTASPTPGTIVIDFGSKKNLENLENWKTEEKKMIRPPASLSQGLLHSHVITSRCQHVPCTRASLMTRHTGYIFKFECNGH